MVVRQDQALDRRQFAKRQRRLMKALGPGKAERRDPLAEHWIDQPVLALKLEQVRRMAEPDDVVGRRVERVQRGALQRAHRDRVAWASRPVVLRTGSETRSSTPVAMALHAGCARSGRRSPASENCGDDTGRRVGAGFAGGTGGHGQRECADQEQRSGTHVQTAGARGPASAQLSVHVGRLDDVGEHLEALAHVGVELLGRGAGDGEAHLLEARCQRFGADRLVHVGIDLGDDLGRRAAGQADAEVAGKVEVGKHLARRLNLRCAGVARAAHHRRSA